MRTALKLDNVMPSMRRGFRRPQLLRERNPMQRFPMVLLRLIAFIAVWIAAFALLPTLWVGIALALYLPVGICGIRKVYINFQNETT